MGKSATPTAFLDDLRKNRSGTRRASASVMPATWNLADRTMEFAVNTFRYCRTLPRGDEAREIARQLRRAASSTASNYRAARRGRSDAEFVAKMGQIIEEADESLFWFEFLVQVEIAKKAAVANLRCEANELVAIFMAARKTAKSRLEAARKRRKRQQTT